MKHAIPLCLLLLSANLSGFSQTSKKLIHSNTYRYLGIREGLIQSQALLSFEDSYGYIWFSTYDGVSRFDGLHFDNFSPEELDIAGSRVKYFNQYKSAVYMLSGRNIVFVYPDRTVECYPLPNSSLLLSMDYHAEAVAVENNLYIFNCQSPDQSNMEHFSIVRFDLENKIFTPIAEKLPFLKVNVFEQKIYALPRGVIQNRQVMLYRIVNDQLLPVQSIQMEKDDLYADFKKTNRNEWFAVVVKGQESNLTRHIYRCFLENDSIRRDFIGTYFTENWGDFRLERWDDDRLFIGTNTPGYPALILDTEKHSLSAFPLSMVTVNHILVDKDGNIWFSTEDGVYQCSRILFESYRLGLGQNDNIWGVIKDSHDNIWFSSYTYGLWRADVQKNLYQPQIVYDRKAISIQFGYMGNCEDKRGRVFQTTNSGLAVFDPEKGNSNRLNMIPAGISLAVYYDEESGNIYFGGDSGSRRTLNILRTDGEIASYPSANRYIVSICRDGNRKLRLGLYSGEAWFDEKNRVVVSDAVQRAYEGVIAMALDENGILWKGTSNGLFAEDRQGNDSKIFDGKVNLVIQYKNQYLIWGVKDKVYLLDLTAYHRDLTIDVRTFGFYDGYNLLECIQNGASIDHEGYVWVAGGDKVIRFHPEKIMKVSPIQIHEPYLAAIYNANKNSEWSLVPADFLTEFDNNDNFLRFDWLQASVSVPDRLVFRYRLNGYSEQWSTTQERSAVFQNLPFGKYCFELQSSVNDREQWSESVFSPAITIRNPFLLTVPGLLLIFSGLAGIGFLIYYYTRKTITRKEKEKQDVAQLKYRAVQAKFIPHFTGNVLNSINYLIMKNPDSARKYVSKFSDFSNQTLRNSDKQTRSLQEELDYSQLYLELEKLRFEEKLEYSLFIDPAVNLQKMIPTMILQTFCENAIKHGLRPKQEGGKIATRVYPETDFTVISVEDNGIGRAKAESLQTQGTGEGLKIVQQQLDIFNKNQSKAAYLNVVDLFDEAGQVAGTRFELYVYG